MRYCPILFCFPLREDDFVDKEEDQHQNVTVEHRGSDVIDKVRHQQARNRRSHAVDEVNEAGDQTECQHHQQGKGQLVGKLHGKTPVLWTRNIIISPMPKVRSAR